jgi:hypothetical protein
LCKDFSFHPPQSNAASAEADQSHGWEAAASAEVFSGLIGRCVIERGRFMDFEPRRRFGAADSGAAKSSLAGQVTRH